MQEMLDNLVRELNNATADDWYNAGMWYLERAMWTFRNMNPLF